MPKVLASSAKSKKHGVPRAKLGSRRQRDRPELNDEAALEARLFGAPKSTKLSKDLALDDEAETGLGWMQDSDLFAVDVPADDWSGELDEEPIIELPEDVQHSQPDENGEPTGLLSLWKDPADLLVRGSLQSSKRLKKLSRAKPLQSSNVTGIELQQRLREQFERLHPKPVWASRREQVGAPSIQKLLSSSASFVDESSKIRGPLPAGSLDIQRLGNIVTPGESASSSAAILDMAWHPSARMPVLAVATSDRRVRFFHVDGHTNANLLSIHLPSLPVTSISWHPSGSALLLTGPRPFYYVYDLVAQACIRSPRNLFGSAPTPTSPQSLERHSFSPDGSLLAFAGRRGAVSVVEWGQGGSTGVVMAELRSGRGGAVGDFSWSGEAELSVLGGRDGAEVEVWDVRERKVIRRWKDNQAFGGQCLRETAGYAAVGSTTGIVTLYNSSTAPRSSDGSLTERESLKSLEHLTTPITSMAFHPSCDLFVSASSSKQRSLRAYHLPSATAFSNWPTGSTPLGRVTALGFSSGGEYFAVGNKRGAVLLWNLKHFTA